MTGKTLNMINLIHCSASTSFSKYLFTAFCAHSCDDITNMLMNAVELIINKKKKKKH